MYKERAVLFHRTTSRSGCLFFNINSAEALCLADLSLYERWQKLGAILFNTDGMQSHPAKTAPVAINQT